MKNRKIWNGLAIAVTGAMLMAGPVAAASADEISLEYNDKRYILEDEALAPEDWESMTDEEKEAYLEALLENHEDQVTVKSLKTPVPAPSEAEEGSGEAIVPAEGVIPEATEGVETAPVGDEEPAGDSTAEESPAEDSTAEDSAAEEDAAEDITAEDSAAEEDAAEDSAAEESPAEDSTAEDSTVEDSTAEDSTVEDSTTEESPAEDSTAEDSAAENSTGENGADVTVETADAADTAADGTLTAPVDLGTPLVGAVSAPELESEEDEAALNGTSFNKAGPGSTELVGKVDEVVTGSGTGGSSAGSGASAGSAGNASQGGTGSSALVSQGSSQGSAVTQTGTTTAKPTDTGKKTTNPKTGDGSGVGRYAMMALAAGAVGASAVFGRRKERQETGKNS
ncbi:MAG: hypothetical protein PUA52_09695 [Lachnospiraceae bacterium]|nr:hypothetical protein [Lachnospiraceae bacterium]